MMVAGCFDDCIWHLQLERREEDESLLFLMSKLWGFLAPVNLVVRWLNRTSREPGERISRTLALADRTVS